MTARGLEQPPEKPARQSDQQPSAMSTAGADLSRPQARLHSDAPGLNDGKLAQQGFPSAESLLPADLQKKASEGAVKQQQAAGRLFSEAPPAQGGVGPDNAKRNLETARQFEQGDPAKGEQTAASLDKIAQGTSLTSFSGNKESQAEQREVVGRMHSPDFRADAVQDLGITEHKGTS